MKTIKTCWMDKIELAALTVAAVSPPRSATQSKTSFAELRAAVLPDSRSLVTPVPGDGLAPVKRARKPSH